MDAMPFVDAAGIHYQSDGASAAPALVLSHSLGMDLAMWDPQLPTLARRHRVIRFDTRGHGASTVTPGPYTIEGLARDALALLDALGIARASFCGLSMGGAIGIWLAVHTPERIERLVLCDTGARFGDPALWNGRIEAVRQGGTAAVADGVLSRWFTPRFAAARPSEVARAREVLLRTPAEGYAACCAALRDVDARDAVPRVRAPTLVIVGSHDVATPPADGRFLADRVPGARCVELDSAHLSNIEAAEPFTEAVAAFLAGG
jgi:3-oxoadipate enol-lactonase